SNLKLMHYGYDSVLQSWVWSNIAETGYPNTTTHTICGLTTSFSDFALMTVPTIPGLISSVDEMNLQQGIENSLDAKLARAQEALDATNSGLTDTAISKLNAFINEVEAQRGNLITTAQADGLHAY